MSRSIHTTRRTLRDLACEVKAKRENADEEFKDAWFEFHRKKRIKRSVDAERRNTPPPLVSTGVEAIPVLVSDQTSPVRHGASREDVRAILARLPEAARHGIAEIRLSLGKAEQEEDVDGIEAGDNRRDPLIGRLGGTLIPGIFCGNVLGRFYRRSGVIEIYAHVVDPSAAILPEPALSLYIRLHALTTLVHEVAHHHDRMTRVRRGRWLADKEENAEAYAEKMTRFWTTQIVPSYLQEAYPTEVRSFLNWVQENTGLDLPLRFFLDETETFFSIGYSLRRWLEEMAESRSILEWRLSFARWIGYADRHDESLLVVDQLLSQRGDWLEALVLRAEVLQFLDRFDEAFEETARILKLEPECVRALEVRSKVLAHRKDWSDLLSNSDVALQFAKTPAEKKRCLMFRAVALCALQRDTEFEQTFAALQDAGLSVPIHEIRARIFHRAGRELTP